MKLTEKECREALGKIQGKCDYLSETFYKYTAWEISESCRIFEKLMYEHFDNPPLTFEELKENMWVWDNKLKEWRKVLEKLIVGVSEGSEFYEDIYVKGTKVIRIGLHKFDWKDILFESKRFYRKEVM